MEVWSHFLGAWSHFPVNVVTFGHMVSILGFRAKVKGVRESETPVALV